MNRNDFPGQMTRTQRRLAIFLAIVALGVLAGAMILGSNGIALAAGLFGAGAYVNWRASRRPR